MPYPDFIFHMMSLPALQIFIKKEVPWLHISPGSTGICTLAHSCGRLRQSTSSRECASLAHECLLCNREFLGISYYTKNGSKLCNLLTDIRCRLSTFRPVSSIYMAPTTGSYGRSQVRRLQLPQTSQEDPGLSGVSSPLRPHHRSRGLRSS